MKVANHVINVQINKNIHFQFDKKWVRSIIKAAFQKEKIAGLVEIDCLITDDFTIKTLNKTHRGIDSPTDVLSFAFSDQANSDKNISFPQDPDSPINLGSIIISYERAIEQANNLDHSTKEEIALLLIHGVLHLLGYDHTIQSDARKMRSKERSIIKSL
jgi:probable rRNA maturation factor